MQRPSEVASRRRPQLQKPSMSQVILTGLIWAFSFWMVADCLWRRASPLWVVAILLVQPYGAIAYVTYLAFIQRRAQAHGASPTERGLRGAVVAAREPGATRESPQPPAYPTPLSLDVADQLEEQRRFAEAAPIYRRALAAAEADPRALHGLARCLSELEQPREAVEAYEALMAVDPRYRHYTAALEYAEALHRAGRTVDATGLLEGLVEETARPNHRLALAHYYEAGGEPGRARRVLEGALAAYASSPLREQHANRRWHRRIAAKLEQLASG